ncbi:hypothetical protein B0I35DRAFT_180156 [Stachybotrys elegans]|uniref:Uncharacterized protein n=1 Tax=Stachybotrys elegans TaxID=80388 RepID=A0A8K0SBJ0_9HYPO|nr:hypothetical protein B0I35DRAFT_180156 [Stachybotrys elegans]
MEYKAYSAQTRQDLAAIAKQNGDRQVILQLNKRELTSPASRWNIRHLIVYRLLVYQNEAFLSELEADHDTYCPLCRDSQSSPQKLNHARTQDLIAENPRDFFMKTDCEIMQSQDGFLWAALREAARPELTNQAEMRPQRERKQVQREGYIDSASAIPGSSSPILHSSSEFEADMANLDEDEHEARRSRPEEVTVHLVLCFLRHVLNLCLIQHPPGLATEVEARPRIERRTTNAYVAGNVLITAEDDGGICSMHKVGSGWEISQPFLALLEAKRAFKYVRLDESTGNYIPVISNENLAQCLGEAIITKKGNPLFLKEDVFLIAANSTYMCFFHFKFGDDYVEYLDATNETAQRELVNDEGKDTCVYMHGTKWYNLLLGEGRRNALCHILSVLRWHDARDVRHQAAGDFTEGSDDYDLPYGSGDNIDHGFDSDSMDTEL